MPTIPKPTLDDLCLAMARFLNCLERADRNTLLELHERVSTGRHALQAVNQATAALIMAEITKRKRGVN
jgi:hypothetical protein